MYQFPIGVIIESFRVPTAEALAKAEAIGANGIQMYATEGDHAPENLNCAQRRDLLNLVKAHNLKFSALCGDLGRGFTNPEINPQLIEKSKKYYKGAVKGAVYNETKHMWTLAVPAAIISSKATIICWWCAHSPNPGALPVRDWVMPSAIRS